MRGKAVTVNVRMPKYKGKKRATRRRAPYQSLKSTGWVRGTPASIAQFGQNYRTATGDQLMARRNWNYTGNGMYTGGHGMYTGGHGGYWGEKLGSLVGLGGLGSALGDLGGSLIRNVVPGGNTAMDIASGVGKVMGGHGSYAVNDAIAGGSPGDPVPTFAPSSDGTRVTISHKEYISDIFGPGAPGFFQNTQYALNPAIERTFPWLSQIAAQYQEYTFSQLIFTFKSTVTDFNSGTGQVGTMVMVTQYNPSDEAFSDKMTMLESDLASSGKVSGHVLHGVECDPSKLSGSIGKYTRVGPPQGTQDIKTYDLGNLNVAICNIPANFFNQSLGELHVSYTVELRKPKQFSSKGWSIPRDAWYLKPSGDWGGPKTIYGPTNSITTGQQNTINCQIIPAGPVTDAEDPGSNEKFAYDATRIESEAMNNIYIVFPATAEGHYKVVLKYGQLYNAGAAKVPAYVSLIGKTDALETIYDILGPLGTWTDRVTPFDTEPVITVNAGGFRSTATFEIHVRVTNPAGSTPVAGETPVNAALCLGFTDNTGAFEGLDLQIEQYNTLFNTKQDGSADMPIVCVQNDLFTNSGIIVPNWA